MRLTRFFARIVFNLRRANTFRSAVFYVHFSSAMLLLFSIPAFAIPAVAAGTSILDYHTLIKVEKGKLIQELDIEIQVNSKREDWIAEISIRYGEHDKLEILEAYITNPHGEVVRKLKKKDVISRSEVSADTFFENNLLQEFELKWHEYPYKIRYKYRRTTDQYIYIARWYPILFKSVPVLHATLQVQVPDDLEVLINYSDSLHYKAAKEEGITLHTWQSSYHNELSGQPYEVNLLERLPFVGIVPKDFVYVAPGSFSSWAEFGDWQSRILAGLDELPRSEQLVVDQLISGKNDEKEIIKTLYQHLQDHTRYVNVSIDEGGLVPYPSSYVCANKYGDCKALTNYMKALLSYAGITSYYTLINAGENVQRIDRAFPSQQFNHVILCVPLQQDTIWLENTSKYLPAGYIGTFTQNRYGLMVNGAESKLVKTPALGLEDVLENSIYHLPSTKKGQECFRLVAATRVPNSKNSNT
ncbi:MAG: DUF3857 and transglutaminase domain-containing protein [Cyclobacteriaceae bacterium]|nr:DUF3857 and transglutaminase domain-containing protein [Cyclobacteriaceae bacterium]